MQRDALKGAGCQRIFEDTVSGAKADRIGLATLLNVLRAGDTVVIWRPDWLDRSLRNLIQLRTDTTAQPSGLLGEV